MGKQRKTLTARCTHELPSKWQRSMRRFSVGTVLHVDGRGFGLTTRVVTPQTQDGACVSLQVTGHLTPGLHPVPLVMRASDLNDG